MGRQGLALAPRRLGYEYSVSSARLLLSAQLGAYEVRPLSGRGFGLRTGFKYIKWFQAVSETEVYILRFSGSGRDSYRVTLHYIDLDTNPTGSTGGVENGLKYWNLYQGGSQQFFWTYASGLDPFTGYLGYGGADTALDGGRMITGVSSVGT